MFHSNSNMTWKDWEASKWSQQKWKKKEKKIGKSGGKTEVFQILLKPSNVDAKTEEKNTALIGSVNRWNTPFFSVSKSILVFVNWVLVSFSNWKMLLNVAFENVAAVSLIFSFFLHFIENLSINRNRFWKFSEDR